MSETTVEKTVLGWVSEAIDLRHGDAGDDEGPLKIVSLDDGIHAVAYELQRVRKRTDRVDFLRTQISLIKSHLRKQKSERDFEAESTFNQAVSNRDRVKNEYASALSVKSNASLDSFNELRAAHEAKMKIDLVNECYEVVDRIGRQLDGIANDLRTMLRSLQFMSSLDH